VKPWNDKGDFMVDKFRMPGYLIYLIDHAFHMKRNEMLLKYGITSSQNKVLRCLWEEDGLSQSDILKQLSVRAPSLTKLVEQLEKKGMIDRKICAEDGRAKMVYLTESGRNLKGKSLEVVYYLEDKLFEGFKEDEKREAVGHLTRMLENIKEGA
jgi:DNA-binding MarR family transcriptional regulator